MLKKTRKRKTRKNKKKEKPIRKRKRNVIISGKGRFVIIIRFGIISYQIYIYGILGFHKVLMVERKYLVQER